MYFFPFLIVKYFSSINVRNNVTLFYSQVLKFLMEKSSMSTVHGQITIGTLILQVFIILSLCYSIVDVIIYLKMLSFY